MEDFNGIYEALTGVLADIETMMEEQNNRTRFLDNYAILRQKYEEADIEFDVLSVLDGVAESVEKELNRKDQAWSEKHLTSVPDDRLWTGTRVERGYAAGEDLVQSVLIYGDRTNTWMRGSRIGWCVRR